MNLPGEIKQVKEVAEFNVNRLTLSEIGDSTLVKRWVRKEKRKKKHFFG
jgi:hypothetical protein